MKISLAVSEPVDPTKTVEATISFPDGVVTSMNKVCVMTSKGKEIKSYAGTLSNYRRGGSAKRIFVQFAHEATAYKIKIQPKTLRFRQSRDVADYIATVTVTE